MENNGIVKSTICFTLGMLITFPVFVSAYSDITTHPALTSETIIFFNTHHPADSLNNEEKQTLMRGSVGEDERTRAFQHFYDPVHNRGLTLEEWKPELTSLDIVFPIDAMIAKVLVSEASRHEWQSSKGWAESTLAQASYNGNIISNPVASISYGTLKEYYSSDTDYSWERAIYEYAWKDKERGLESLGHILHLIQDASVPDHTRNDPHPPAFHFGSHYETWTGQFGPDTIDVAGKMGNKKPVAFNTLGEYFDSIANYSNNNFFSKDTIFSKEYEDPKITGEIIWKKLKDGQFYQFVLNKKGGLLLSTGYRKFGKIQEDRTIKDPDHLILTDYWNLLSQQAVLHGAGVIKLFFDEVEKEKETKVLYDKNKNWFQRIFDFTQKGVYQTATALYGGSVPYDELENAAQEQQARVVAAQDENTSQESDDSVAPDSSESPDPAVKHPVIDVETDASATIPDADESSAAPTAPAVVPVIYDDPSKATPYQPGFGGGGSRPDSQSEENQNTTVSESASESGGEAATTTPTVSAPLISSPSADTLSITETSLTFSGTASSTLVISNNVNSATTTPDENENWSLELTGLSEGETSVQFIATNSDGMTATSSSKTISVDTTAPTIDSFTVLQCSYSLSASTCLSGGATVNLSWTSTSTDISYVGLVIDGIQTATTTGLSGTVSVSVGGTYSVQIALYDAIGHGATSTAQSVTTVTRPLVINEIAWGGTGAGATDEWIELYNPSSHNISLGNISLVAEDGTPDISLAHTATSSEYYLIERTGSTTTSVSEDLVVAFSGSGEGSGLGNDGEVLRLVHYLGGYATTTLDETPSLSDCGNTWCKGTASPNYLSMERVSAGATGTLSSNWKSNNTFTRNGTDANGAALNGTPRAQNSVSLLSVGYFCPSETSSFVEGGYYTPTSGSCTYVYTNASGNWYGDLYRGTVASSTIVNGHSLGNSPSAQQGDSISNGVQGESLFAAIFKVRTGPAYNDLSDFRNFFQNGANSPPHLDYGVIHWIYGVAP